jgi:hypothetical protein
MKNKVLITLGALISIAAIAGITTQQKYIGNNYFGAPGNEIQLGTLLDKNLNAVKFEYSVASNTGSTGAHSLGVALPASAIIVRSYFEITEQFASASGAGAIALHCETANNIFSAADIEADAAGTMKEGESTGAASAFKKITSECNITATNSVEAATAGALNGWVEYVISD